MTELCKAVQGFLEQARLPVYMEGQVPSGTRTPYAVWSLEAGGEGEDSRLTVTCWYRRDHAGCVAALACMRELFGPGGAVIRYPGGLAAGFRGTAAFVHDELDRALEGGRLHVAMRVFEYARETEGKA